MLDPIIVSYRIDEQ